MYVICNNVKNIIISGPLKFMGGEALNRSMYALNAK